MTLCMLPCRSSSTSSSSKRKKPSNFNSNKPKSSKKTSKKISRKSVSVFTPPNNNWPPIRWTTKKPTIISTLHNVSVSNLNKNSTKSIKSTTPKDSKWTSSKVRSQRLKNNLKISCVTTMKYKLTTSSSSPILPSPKSKPSQLKIMLRIFKKSRRNKISWLTPWTNKANDWKNKKIFWPPKSSPKKNKLKKPGKSSKRLKLKWKKSLPAKRTSLKDGKSQSCSCKRKTPLSKLWEKESKTKMKRTFCSKAKFPESAQKSESKKNWQKN